MSSAKTSIGSLSPTLVSVMLLLAGGDVASSQSVCSECSKVLAVNTYQDTSLTKEQKETHLSEQFCSKTEDQSREEVSSGGGLGIPLFLDINGHYDSTKFHDWYTQTCFKHSRDEWLDLFEQHSRTDNTAAVVAWTKCIQMCHTGFSTDVIVHDQSQVTLILENGVAGGPHTFAHDVTLPVGVKFQSMRALQLLGELKPSREVLFHHGDYLPFGHSEWTLDRGGHQDSFQLTINTTIGVLSAYFPTSQPIGPAVEPPTRSDLTVDAKQEHFYIGSGPLVILSMDGAWTVDPSQAFNGPEGTRNYGKRANGLWWGQAVVSIESGPIGARRVELRGWEGPCIAIPASTDVFVYINDQDDHPCGMGSCWKDNLGEMHVHVLKGAGAACPSAAVVKATTSR